jgi:hypothetical protein
VVSVKHDRAAVERAGIHHPGGDLAAHAGQLFEPVHRRFGAHVGQMRQIDAAAKVDERGQARLQSLCSDIGIGLRRQLGLHIGQRRGGHRLPAAPAAKQAIGRGVRNLGLGPRPDHALHQHPFGLAPFGRRALHMAEPLDQQRLQAADGCRARIGAERQFHRSAAHRFSVMAMPDRINAPATSNSRVTSSPSSAAPPMAATSGVASWTVASVASPSEGDTRFHTT